MAKKKGKNKSRYANLIKAFGQVGKSFKDLTPNEAEEQMMLTILKNIDVIGLPLIKALTDPKPNDLTMMSSGTALIAQLALVGMEKSPTRDGDRKAILQAQKVAQRYLLFKAKQLKGGKKKYQALIQLIKDNTKK